MDFVSSEKKESSEAIESDAILNGMRFCLEQKILLSWQRDVMALELYCYVIQDVFVPYQSKSIYCSL